MTTHPTPTPTPRSPDRAALKPLIYILQFALDGLTGVEDLVAALATDTPNGSRQLSKADVRAALAALQDILREQPAPSQPPTPEGEGEPRQVIVKVKKDADFDAVLAHIQSRSPWATPLRTIRIIGTETTHLNDELAASHPGIECVCDDVGVRAAGEKKPAGEGEGDDEPIPPYEFKPDYAVPPGATIGELMRERHLTIAFVDRWRIYYRGVYGRDGAPDDCAWGGSQFGFELSYGELASFVAALPRLRAALAQQQPSQRRDLIGWPDSWPKRYNASNEPCDMLVGPCACGAWHHAEACLLREVLALMEESQQQPSPTCGVPVEACEPFMEVALFHSKVPVEQPRQPIVGLGSATYLDCRALVSAIESARRGVCPHKQEVERLTKERDGLHSQCDHWERIAQRLASDALVVVSRMLPTPENGYLVEPQELRADIGRIVARAQRAVALAERLTRERDEAREIAASRLGEMNNMRAALADWERWCDEAKARAEQAEALAARLAKVVAMNKYRFNIGGCCIDCGASTDKCATGCQLAAMLAEFEQFAAGRKEEKESEASA